MRRNYIRDMRTQNRGTPSSTHTHTRARAFTLLCLRHVERASYRHRSTPWRSAAQRQKNNFARGGNRIHNNIIQYETRPWPTPSFARTVYIYILTFGTRAHTHTSGVFSLRITRIPQRFKGAFRIYGL